MVFHEMVNMLGPCSGSAKPLLPGPLEDAICVTGAPDKVVHWLKYFQTAAVLEVFHALFGLVRSSAFTVFKQVTSRIVVLWLVVWVVPPVGVCCGCCTLISPLVRGHSRVRPYGHCLVRH